MRWHSSPAIYEKECFNFPGFLTVFRKGTDMNNKMNRLDYVNYRHVCHKWHFRLTKSVITCLESKNYSQMRNSVIVLTKILPNFPRMTQIGMAIERRVDKLSKEEKDKRPDIYALVILYAGQLMSKKPTWVQETEFHIKEQHRIRHNSSGSQTAHHESVLREMLMDAPKMSNLNPVQEKRRELQKTTASTCSRVKKEARDSLDQYHRQAGTDQTEDSVRPKTPKEEKLKKSDR
nr:THO complex subunit 2 [Biomphalaria glabrata]